MYLNVNEINKEKRQRATSGLASGGVLARGTLYRYFGSSPPVPTFANPRPTAKPPGVRRQQWGQDSLVINSEF